MSIYFDYETGKTGRKFRRAIESDKYDIELILKSIDGPTVFGQVDVGALIELSVLSICMINENKEVVGFMSLSDHPNLPGVDPSDWENWIRNMYQKYYLSRNTLFIHYMCCIDSITDCFMEEALISVFFNDSYLLHIVLVLPPKGWERLVSRHAAFKKRNLYKYIPKTLEDRDGSFLICALRQDFCPKLKIRRAVEEDNDDVVEILDKTSKRLKEKYGSYYISELIGRHPESTRQILVADMQGRAVGVMCLNTEINYKKLQKIYNLKPYNELHIASVFEKEQSKRVNRLLNSFGEPILRGKWSPYNRAHKVYDSDARESCDDQPEKHAVVIPLSQLVRTASKVNFMSEKLRQSINYIIKHEESEELSDKYSYFPTMERTLSVFNHLLDDDPFDYDIVNIDTNWLTEVPSCEIKTYSSISCSKQAGKFKKKVFDAQARNRSISIEDSVFSTTTTLKESRNAFMIELFALREDIDERRAFDMLEAAFEFMQQFEYCIIRVPTGDRSFHLLQHFCYVPMKQRVCCDYALYIAHRSSVMGKLRVREAEIIDIPEIALLLHPLDATETLCALEDIICNNTDTQAYVFTSGLSLVGLGIVEPAEEIDVISACYNLNSYQFSKYRNKGYGLDTGFAAIRMTIVYPVFEVHYRFFARELMRFSGTNTLLYVTDYRNKLIVDQGNALVSSMVPLMPVKFENYNDIRLKKISKVSDNIEPFSAWFISKKITNMPKVTISTKIVIIGTSRTAMGFLRSLLFCQTSTYLTFTSVTLVSPYGLPYTKNRKIVAESMFLSYYANDNKYLKSIPYSYYINVIQGTMAEINLQKKFITLTSGKAYQYDLLFLLYGKQYQPPSYMMHLIERETENRYRSVPKYNRLDIPRFSDTEIQISCDDTPDNVFIINHVLDADKALEYAKRRIWPGANFIVYGNTIHAYLCIKALLKIQVPPANIIFIEPFPSEKPHKTRIPEFTNIYVDQTVSEVLKELKINIYRSFYFQNWVLDTQNHVTHAEFMSYSDYLKFECTALFYYGKRGINMRAYIAIHKSGLPYDGGLIIDGECCTRDPSVYAAGPNTCYHRKYYADSHSHKYHDTYEVGFQLGTRIRNKLDPMFTGICTESNRKRRESMSTTEIEGSASEQSCELKNTMTYPNLMILKKPKVKCCILPGDLRFLQVRAPGLKLPHHYLQSLDYNGIVMETFKDGYFKIHLNKDLIVDYITCLKPAKYPLEKFQHLYGHSAVVLKNVHLRYGVNQVDDFYQFFNDSWASFLYHEQADDLFTMSKELFPKGCNTGETIRETLSNAIKGDYIEAIRENFKKSSYADAITDYVVQWLSENDMLLPMYSKPSHRFNYGTNLSNIDLFNKPKN